MFCTKCGAPRATGDSFCGQCGASAQALPEERAETPDRDAPVSPPFAATDDTLGRGREESPRGEHRVSPMESPPFSDARDSQDGDSSPPGSGPLVEPSLKVGGNTKFLAGLLVLFLVGVIGYAAVGPFLTMYRIKEAIERKDLEGLSRLVDFPVLRENLKEQANALVIEDFTEEMTDDPFAALTIGLASKMAEVMVESLITPAGLAHLMEGGGAPRDRDSAPSVGLVESVAGLLVNARYTYDSASRVSLWIEGKEGDRDGDDGRFVFFRHGVSWRLSNIVIPQIHGEVGDPPEGAGAERGAIRPDEAPARSGYDDGADDSITSVMAGMYGNWDPINKRATWAGIAPPTTLKFGSYLFGVTGTVNVFFDEEYAESGRQMRAVMTRTVPEGAGCGYCSPLIGGAILVKEAGRWVVDASETYLTTMGRVSQAPQAELVKIGPERHGVLLSDEGQPMGYGYRTVLLVAQHRAGLTVVLELPVKEDNEGACVEPSKCWGWSSDFQFTEGKSSDFFDVVVRRSGTESGENGEIREVKETERFRFEDGQYVNLDSRED